MKRILSILLVLSLCLALAACGGAPKLPVPGGDPVTEAPATKAPETQAPTTAAPTTAAPATEAPTTEAPTTDAPTTEAPATEAPAQETSLTHGVIEDGVYTNESLHLRFTLPEGWVFYTEEEIAQVNNMTTELLEDGDIREAVATTGQFMELFAVNNTTSENINLILQPGNAMLNSMTDEEIFTLLEDTYRSQFSAAGMTVNAYEVATVPFCGEEKTALRLEMTMYGVNIVEHQIWLRDVEGCLGILTLTSRTDGTPEQVLEGFSKIQ